MKRIGLTGVIILLSMPMAVFAGGRDDSSSGAGRFPSRAITIVLPPAAGGGTDILVRAMAPVMREFLGQNVIVVNRPGAGGAIGFSSGAKERPDGYSITALVPELLSVPHVTNVDFTFRDFIAINLINTSFGTLAVQADAPYNTVAEFVQYAKANPGTIRFSNSGIGGNWHVLAAAFASHAGIDVVHVPFDGGGPAGIALAGGHVEATTISPQELDIHVRSGRVKILCTFAPERNPSFPDVPTGIESGFPEPILTIFRGFGAPIGTHPEIIKILDDAIRRTLEDPRIVEFMRTQFFDQDYRNAEEFVRLMEREDAIYRDQAESLGLRN